MENNSKTISKLPFPLRDYQSAGVNFLVTRKNILLADEMGLGKTIQTIVSIRILFQEKEINNCLIVVPVSLISNWVFEFGIWGGVIKPKIIQGNQKKRLTLYSMQSPVQIVSYESIRNDLELIADSKFYDLVVIDEAQRIKNDTSATSKIIKKIPRKYSWALTGTPLENNIEDIASIFGFVKPKTISKYDFPREIKEKIDQFTIRRRKREVLKELPDVIEQTVRISLTPTQWTTYENTRSEQYKYIKQLDKKEKISGILALITELKKITNFDSYSEESSKADYISDILEEKKMLNEKVIIFSQYVETLKFLERKFHSYKTQMYTGGQSQSERDEIISSYKQSEEFELLLISLKAGGVGLNLQETDTLILFDRWWNPAVESQAIARAHRMGNKKIVHAIKFVTPDSIETRILQLLHEKEELFEDVIEGAVDKRQEFILRNLLEKPENGV